MKRTVDVKSYIYRSESDLVHDLKRGEQPAFNYLYENYSGTLYKVIYQIVPSHVEAEDILQKVFVNIWTKIAGYEQSKGRLFTWILNIARNASIDTLRSREYQYHKRVVNYDPDEIRSMPGRTYQLSIDGIGLYRYVSQLKPQHRQLIEMVYLKGYTQPEVAVLQETPLSTIKTRVKSALSQLRAIIGSD